MGERKLGGQTHRIGPAAGNPPNPSTRVQLQIQLQHYPLWLVSVEEGRWIQEIGRLDTLVCLFLLSKISLVANDKTGQLGASSGAEELQMGRVLDDPTDAATGR